MDDRYAYMLNALWSRHYDLGRVIRFRHVQRGRQTLAYEVLTAEQREYTVYLFLPGYEVATLDHMAQTLDILDKNRFSVVPMVPSKEDQWSVDGPQGQRMMVGLNTDGQQLPPEAWSAHDMSQLGLRLAWMHRLLKEQLDSPQTGGEAARLCLRDQLQTASQKSPADLPHRMPKLNPAHTGARLVNELTDAAAASWCHGDIQPAAFLLDHDRQIRTIVDWGLLHPGDPLEDLIDAFIHWCIGTDGLVNSDTARSLLEAYRTLCPIAKEGWRPAVQCWCAHRIIDATRDLNPLPKGFGQILADPAALVRAIELCEAK